MRFEVYLLNLDDSPVARDTRPCVVVSPDELNSCLASVIVAPVSSVSKSYPTRVMFDFLGNRRAVVLDQIQTVEKLRLTKKIGELDESTSSRIINTLQEMFGR